MIPFVIRMMVRDEVRRRILSEALTDNEGQEVEGLTLRLKPDGLLTAQTSTAGDSLRVTVGEKTVLWSAFDAQKTYVVWGQKGLPAIKAGDKIDLEITAGGETKKATVTVPGGAEAAPSGGSAAAEAPRIVHRSKVRTPLGTLEGYFDERGVVQQVFFEPAAAGEYTIRVLDASNNALTGPDTSQYPAGQSRAIAGRGEKSQNSGVLRIPSGAKFLHVYGDGRQVALDVSVDVQKEVKDASGATVVPATEVGSRALVHYSPDMKKYYAPIEMASNSDHARAIDRRVVFFKGSLGNYRLESGILYGQLKEAGEYRVDVKRGKEADWDAKSEGFRAETDESVVIPLDVTLTSSGTGSSAYLIDVLKGELKEGVEFDRFEVNWDSTGVVLFPSKVGKDRGDGKFDTFAGDPAPPIRGKAAKEDADLSVITRDPQQLTATAGVAGEYELSRSTIETGPGTKTKAPPTERVSSVALVPKATGTIVVEDVASNRILGRIRVTKGRRQVILVSDEAGKTAIQGARDAVVYDDTSPVIFGYEESYLSLYDKVTPAGVIPLVYIDSASGGRSITAEEARGIADPQKRDGAWKQKYEELGGKTPAAPGEEESAAEEGEAAAAAGSEAPAPTGATTAPAPTAGGRSLPTSGSGEIREPQAISSDLAKKIKTAAVAVQGQYGDIEQPGKITIDQVKAENSVSGYTWIESKDAAQYGLRPWDGKGNWGDPYIYFALVSDTQIQVGDRSFNPPRAFVVASDPETNQRASIGKYIGLESEVQGLRGPLRDTFCLLYKRATGVDHPDCPKKGGTGAGSAGGAVGTPSGGTGGGGGGGGGTGGGSSGGGGTDTGGAGGGGGGRGGEGGRGTGGSVGTGGDSIRADVRGTTVVSGRGDAAARGPLNVTLERLSKGGRKFYTRTRLASGFDSMGPGNTATPTVLKRGGKPDGLNPKTIVVVFKKALTIDPKAVTTSPDGTQTLVRQLTTLSPNTGANDIESIGFYYKTAAANVRELLRLGLPRSPKRALGGAFTAKDDPDAFAAAAEWIFSNPQQFDLAEDIEFAVKEPAARGSRPAESGVDESRSLREGSFSRLKFRG